VAGFGKSLVVLQFSGKFSSKCLKALEVFE